jgi:AcrR family transcriptional regulator
MSLQERRQREFERREQEILVAALELCSTPDFESVTVDQIAERAEVGKGTVYKHFSSKDELIFRLNVRFYERLLVQLRSRVRVGSPRQQLRAIIDDALRFHMAHREYRYIVEFCDRIDFMERAEPQWREDFMRLDRAFQEWGVPIIEAGMASGEFGKRPVAEVMLGIRACFEGAVTMLWAGDSWCPFGGDEDTVVNAVTDFILAALVSGGDANLEQSAPTIELPTAREVSS